MAKISPVPHKKSHIKVDVSESLDLDVHCAQCLQWSFSVFCSFYQNHRWLHMTLVLLHSLLETSLKCLNLVFKIQSPWKYVKSPWICTLQSLKIVHVSNSSLLQALNMIHTGCAVWAFLVHGQVNIIFVVYVCLCVCLSVCLFVCAVFLSRLWSDLDQTRTRYMSGSSCVP